MRDQKPRAVPVRVEPGNRSKLLIESASDRTLGSHGLAMTGSGSTLKVLEGASWATSIPPTDAISAFRDWITTIVNGRWIGLDVDYLVESRSPRENIVLPAAWRLTRAMQAVKRS